MLNLLNVHGWHICMYGKLLHTLRTKIRPSAEHYDHCCAIVNSEVNISVPVSVDCSP